VARTLCARFLNGPAPAGDHDAVCDVAALLGDVAHFHGQVWNAAEFARFPGSERANRAALSGTSLSGAFVCGNAAVVRESGKRQGERRSEGFVRDAGLLHTLLGLPEFPALEGHPNWAASGKDSLWSRCCAGQEIGRPILGDSRWSRTGSAGGCGNGKRDRVLS